MKKLLACLVLLSVLTGCITTEVKGFTDHDYQGRHLLKIAVRAPNADFMFGGLLEKSMVEELQRKGVQAESFLEMFPPTRKWTNDQVATELNQKGFDSIMYVNLTGSGASAETVGYINQGSAYVYGNTASFYSTSIPAVRPTRYTSTRVTIYDVASAHTIWIADSVTHAGGLLFMGDKTQTDNLASEIIDALAKSGHL